MDELFGYLLNNIVLGRSGRGHSCPAFEVMVQKFKRKQGLNSFCPRLLNKIIFVSGILEKLQCYRACHLSTFFESLEFRMIYPPGIELQYQHALFYFLKSHCISNVTFFRNLYLNYGMVIPYFRYTMPSDTQVAYYRWFSRDVIVAVLVDENKRSLTSAYCSSLLFLSVSPEVDCKPSISHIHIIYYYSTITPFYHIWSRERACYKA